MHPIRKTFETAADKPWDFELTKIKGKQFDKNFVRGTQGDETVSFELIKDNERWKIIPPAPSWVLLLEERFSYMIQQERQHEI